MAWFGIATYIKDKTISKQMNQDFQSVFSGDIGTKVLNAILTDLHFYGETITEEDRILQNAAKRILYRLGKYRDGKDIEITKFLKGGE